ARGGATRYAHGGRVDVDATACEEGQARSPERHRAERAMRATMVERSLWGVTAIATLAAVLGVRSVEKRTDAPVPTKVTAPAELRRIDPDSLFQSAAHLASNDPFRLSHQPPSVAYSPALEGLAPPPPVA